MSDLWHFEAVFWPLWGSLMAIWDLHAKLGLFWDQIWTLVPFGTKSQIWDFIGAPAESMKPQVTRLPGECEGDPLDSLLLLVLRLRRLRLLVLLVLLLLLALLLLEGDLLEEDPPPRSP